MTEARRSFGEKLAHLIETVHPPDRGPYSYREIEAGLAQQPGAMTAAYVNQLVKGKQPNPRIHYVEALAAFFGVPASYFFDEDTAARVDEQLANIRVWRDEQALSIAERVVELTPRDRHTVNSLIDNLRLYDEQPRERRARRKPRSDT